MSNGNDEIKSLRSAIEQKKSELDGKRAELICLVKRLAEAEAKAKERKTTKELNDGEKTPKTDLYSFEIERYSRQLILPGFGVNSQKKLRAAKILIVGMGGLGCPAAQYLAAAGCGHIGLIDYDTVDHTNLQRQILHPEENIGLPKVESARWALEKINSHIKLETYNFLLNSDNVLPTIDEAAYDVVLDCTDNVATRYLLNDACVLLSKPLVSGSAIQFDGQLTVYHFGDECPCYRCLYPVPPPVEAVTNCGDGGVLGAVTGIIGSMQALEAIKIVCSLGDVHAGRLLVFDGLLSKFRNIKLRGRRVNCDVCSDNPLIRQPIDYEQFCGMRASDKDYRVSILSDTDRVTVKSYNELFKDRKHLLIDVRPPAEFEMCRIENSVNVPLKSILNNNFIKQFPEAVQDENMPIILLCRRGNDSQIAAQHIKMKLPKHTVHDLVGGLHSWHYEIDKNFPIY